MQFLGLLLGVALGAAEFFLTKAIVSRAMAGKAPVVLLLLKLASYAATLLPVFFCTERAFAIRFGIGVGAGMLGTGLIVSVCSILRETR